MKNRKNIFKIISILFCAHLISGCRFELAKNPTSAKSRANQQELSKPVQSQNQKVEGTSDSGGGNGIDNKMLESYIINPTELEEVSDIVIPILMKTKRQEDGLIYKEIHSPLSEAEAKTEAEKSVKLFFKIKTWYLAPVELKKLPKKALGIEFAESSFQQIAIQTENEIWINAKLYSKMSSTEKAKLIMHEVVMAKYLAKFYSYEEFLKMVQIITYDNKNSLEFLKNPESQKYFEKLYGFEQPRPLNGNDYNSIREATAFLFRYQEELNSKMWKQKLKSLNFPKMFSMEDSSDLEAEDQEVKYKDFKQMFQAAKVTNKLPTNCNFVEFKEIKNCLIEYSFEDRNDKYSPNYLKLTLKNLNGTFIKSMTISVYDDMSVSKMGDKKSIILLSGNWNNSVIGTNRNTVEILFGDKGLVEIVLKSELLIKNIERIKVVDGIKQKCTFTQYGEFNPKSLEENTVYIRHDNSASDSILLNLKLPTVYEDCEDLPEQNK